MGGTKKCIIMARTAYKVLSWKHTLKDKLL